MSEDLRGGTGGKTQDGWAFLQLQKTARPASTKDPLEALDHAWQRYRERAEALVQGATPESRVEIHAVLDKNAVDLLGLADRAAE